VAGPLSPASGPIVADVAGSARRCNTVQVRASRLVGGAGECMRDGPPPEGLWMARGHEAPYGDPKSPDGDWGSPIGATVDRPVNSYLNGIARTWTGSR
jgi:hypothetical protein